MSRESVKLHFPPRYPVISESKERSDKKEQERERERDWSGPLFAEWWLNGAHERDSFWIPAAVILFECRHSICVN